ncbi:ATP-binding protein [Rheinheimera sp.]|uniref:ATP-binding protein n=1 Tax=Rheinheimera sp. TaxID=1869214 RepID=UPI00307CFC90
MIASLSSRVLRVLCWVTALMLGPALNVSAMTRLRVDDGLPNASIYQILQDDAGYIWLGSTNTGLLRYDGYSFETFELHATQEGKTSTVPDIDAMLLADGQLWLGTWGMGLSRLDVSTGVLSHYSTAADSALALHSNFIQSLFLDASKRLWIGCRDGLQRLDPDGSLHSIGRPDQPQSLVSQRVWAVRQSLDGRIWIATSQGLHWYSDTAGLSAAVMVPQLNQVEVRALHLQDGILWVVARNRLVALNTLSMQAADMPLPDQFPLINAVLAEPDGQLLLATFDGIYRFDPKRARLIGFDQSDLLLPGVNVRSLMIDKTGLLWAGSREKGLFYGRYSGSAFRSLDSWGPQLSKVAQLTPTSVLAEDKVVWLGTSDAVYRISRQPTLVQAFSVQSRVNAIRRDQAGQLWVGTDVGLWRYNESTAQLLPWQGSTALQASGLLNVRDVLSSQDGSLWLGLWQRGVLQLKPDGQWQYYLENELQQRLGDAVQSMALIEQQLWIGTRYSGTFVLDLKTGQLHNLATLLQSTEQQRADIQCIARGPDQTVLLCSSERLLQVDLKQRQITELTIQRDGPRLPLLGAYTDAQQNIWLMTAKGLKFKPYQQPLWVGFGQSDGLLNDEMLFNVWSASAEGELYLGTAGGLVLVRPAALWLNRQPPQVRVSAVRIGSTPLKPAILQHDWPELQLEPGQDVELSLASLDFHEPQRNQFRYLLEGIDSEWQYSQGRTRVLYHQLPAGHYRFVFNGSNQHGFFHPEPRQLRIRVLPHWWQRTEVMAMAALLLLLLVVAAHGYRLRHIRQINKLLQQSVQDRAHTQMALETMVTQRTKELEDSSVTLSLRSRQLEQSLARLAENNHELTRLNRLKDEFISTVSHELRTPLTSIRGAVGLVASGAVAPTSEHYQQLLQTALGNAERLSTLINDLLDVQKFESGHFQLHPIQLDLAQLVTEAVHAFNPYAQEYQVAVHMKLQPCVVLADAGRLRQVLDNLLSNAIKFSESGQSVQLTLFTKDQKARLEVQDQGCGISDEFRSRVFEKFSQADSSSSRKTEGTGLGLTICKSIIEAHQGQIGFYSQTGQGSTFWFELRLADSTD